MKKPVAKLYRATGWSSSDGTATERQPHLFYRAEEIDIIFDALKRQHKFELRKAAALEKFYLKELRR